MNQFVTPTDATDYTTASGSTTITVNQASLTATANNQSKVYGAANPALTISYSGFVNGDTSASITQPGIATAATAASGVGTYPITLSGGSAANYSLTLVNGTLTVSQAQSSLSPGTSANATVFGQAITCTGTAAAVFLLRWRRL